MTWTAEDEKQLQALQNRKANHTRVLEECVDRMVSQHFHYDMSLDQITNTLIENATQIRKVLEPFDKEFTK